MFDIFVSIFDRGSWSINAHIQFEHFIWDRNNFSELSKTLSYELLAKRSISAQVICKCGFFLLLREWDEKKGGDADGNGKENVDQSEATTYCCPIDQNCTWYCDECNDIVLLTSLIHHILLFSSFLSIHKN